MRNLILVHLGEGYGLFVGRLPPYRGDRDEAAADHCCHRRHSQIRFLDLETLALYGEDELTVAEPESERGDLIGKTRTPVDVAFNGLQETVAFKDFRVRDHSVVARRVCLLETVLRANAAVSAP